MNGVPVRPDAERLHPRRRFMESIWLFVTHPFLLVAVGGAIGSVARFAVGRWVDAWFSGAEFPFGTFVVNIVGSFILGILALWVLERLPPNFRGLYLLFGTGFCGGFTTFSTFEWETYKLVRDGSWWLAGFNVIGSVICGFVGIIAAAIVVSGVFGKPLANG
jgi:fluoride exporter